MAQTEIRSWRLSKNGDSFRLKGVPPRRTLLRITQVSWIVGGLAAANVVLFHGGGVAELFKLLRTALIAYCGKIVLTVLDPVLALFVHAWAILIPLAVIVGLPTGLVTLIVAVWFPITRRSDASPAVELRASAKSQRNECPKN